MRNSMLLASFADKDSLRVIVNLLVVLFAFSMAMVYAALVMGG